MTGVQTCALPISTPTYLNAGRKQRGELASCYLFTMDDTLNSINFIRSQVSQASKIAGGVAVNLTRLRGRGATLKGVKNVGKGIVPVAKLIEGEVSYADQLGQRAGAGAAYLNIFHSDVIELLNTKKVNADEDTRLATLSIGLISYLHVLLLLVSNSFTSSFLSISYT